MVRGVSFIYFTQYARPAQLRFTSFDLYVLLEINATIGNFMLIAKVVGSAVATIKDEKLNGTKLLVVREANVQGEVTGKPLVAIDTVDAGAGDLVLIASGSSARQTTVTKDRPVDAVIMAILDSLEVDGEVTFRKS